MSGRKERKGHKGDESISVIRERMRGIYDPIARVVRTHREYYREACPESCRRVEMTTNPNFASL